MQQRSCDLKGGFFYRLKNDSNFIRNSVRRLKQRFHTLTMPSNLRTKHCVRICFHSFHRKGFLASHDLYVVSSKEKFMAAMSLLSKENGCRQRTTVQENHLLCMCSQTINHDLIIILKSPCSSYATFNGYPSKPQTYFWPQLPTAMTKSLHTRASPLKQELISNLKCTHGWVVRTTKTIATHLMRRQFATREDKYYKYTHEFVLFQ